MRLLPQRLIKPLRLTLAVLSLAALSALVADAWVRHATTASIYVDIAKLPWNRVSLVLGCSERLADGRENLFFRHRMDAAAALYHEGKCGHFLLSGDNGSVEYNEPGAMAAALQRRGVPADCMTQDFAGFRTLDSIIRAQEVFGQESVTIVSQRFHLERALYIAKESGLSAVGFAAQDVERSGAVRTLAREKPARVKTLFDLHVNKTGPRFLGARIEILDTGEAAPLSAVDATSSSEEK